MQSGWRGDPVGEECGRRGERSGRGVGEECGRGVGEESERSGGGGGRSGGAEQRLMDSQRVSITARIAVSCTSGCQNSYIL